MKKDPARTLRAKFKDSGLQVIVKLASIELTPEKPLFAGGEWHVEGQMNEHIAGTALYYLSENVTPSFLKFRMQTSSYQDQIGGWKVDQDAYHWMQRVYGALLGCGNGTECLQSYGSVETRHGRLLAFPNCFQHRVTPFELQDPTKPGYRRLIALWLVDPYMRITNTGNVPPQQASWWMERLLDGLGPDGKGTSISNSRLEELSEVVFQHAGDDASPTAREVASDPQSGLELRQSLADKIQEIFGEARPLTRKQAEGHRDALMDVRKAFQNSSQTCSGVYSFCEH